MCISMVKGERVALAVLVKPKARKTAILGLHHGMVKLAIASPPVDGKANREVVRFLAELFNLKKKQVTILRGERSREKVCLLGDLDERTVRSRLDILLDHQR